jgi:antirestriction protein
VEIMQIYIACLASYNAGHLHGAWIDVSSDADAMREEVAAVLASSPVPGAEEWAVHDYDGFPDMGEYPGLDAIAATAELYELAAEYDIGADDFRAIAANWHGVRADILRALDNFAGIFDRLRDFADGLADETLAAHGIKEGDFAQQHFDYESHARDIEIEYDVVTCPSGVAVFYPH